MPCDVLRDELLDPPETFAYRMEVVLPDIGEKDKDHPRSKLGEVIEVVKHHAPPKNIFSNSPVFVGFSVGFVASLGS